MNEYLIVWQMFMSFLVCSVGALFYSIGGRDDKWLRRFVGTCVISVGFWIIAALTHKFKWWMFLMYPYLSAVFTIGYGGDEAVWRVFKRGSICLYMIILGLIITLLMGYDYWRLLIQAILGAVTVIFAFRNPFSAAFEEGFISLLFTVPLFGYLF